MIKPSTRVRTWRDVDLSLARTQSGDVSAVVDFDAIKRQMRNVILCERYDYPFHPEIATGVRGLNFENWDESIGITAQRMVANSIRQYVQRVSLISVDVTFDETTHSMTVTVDYRVAGTPQTAVFESVIERVR
jgi:phage baseplate assembly protein W